MYEMALKASLLEQNRKNQTDMEFKICFDSTFLPYYNNYY